jgi:hypothetical protein
MKTAVFATIAFGAVSMASPIVANSQSAEWNPLGWLEAPFGKFYSFFPL